MGYWNYNDKLIDPLKGQGNILTPLNYTTTENIIYTTEIILNNNTTQVNQFGAQLITPNFKVVLLTILNGASHVS